MTKGKFELKILELHWIKHEDDPTDLCVHGHVFVKIGNEIIADKNTFDITLSSTALYLLRTAQHNYKKNDYASQLLPCCGHFFMADEEKNDFVIICGCPNGIDWTIIHTDDNKVKHITESGQEAIIEKASYKNMVLDFADQVENFYKTCLPKNIPTDEFERKGYLTFWKEWNRLRNEILSINYPK